MSEFKNELAEYGKELLITHNDDSGYSSPIKTNTLQIFLIKETFNDDEAVKGSILITITESFNPKRLVISVLGELNSQESLTNRSHRSTKKFAPLASGEEREVLRQMSKNGSRSNLSKTPTFSRTLTFKSKKPLSRFGTGNSVKNHQVDDSVRSNREVFVHYNIPIFTFKTSKLPPGKYKFPFQFNLSPQIIASFQYNENGFQLAISYFITAALEEDREPNEFDDPNAGHIKNRKELKIMKNKKTIENIPSSRSNFTEVTEMIKIPSMFCYSSIEEKVVLKLDKAAYKVGEFMKFELEFPNIKLTRNSYKLAAHLLQDLATAGESKTNIINLIPNFDRDFYDFIQVGKSSKITGAIRIPENILMTFETPNIDVEHIFEFIFHYNKSCRRSQVTMRASLILTQGMSIANKNRTDTGNLTDDEEDDEEERPGILMMPLMKFKLEEKYNLLSKTAALMEDEDY